MQSPALRAAAVALILALALAVASTTAAAPACPGGQIRRAGKCQKCPPGTYRHEKTPFTADLACAPCPAGTFQPRPGVVASFLCRPCYPGTFSAKPASTACVPCPKRTASQYAAAKCHACGPGTRPRAYGTGCESCPRDTYSAAAVNQACNSCPLGSVTRVVGARSRKSCKPCRPDTRSANCGCSRSEYLPLGSAFCKPCPYGTVSPYGARSLALCRKCPSGKHRGPGMYTCMKCAAGHVANGPGAMQCMPRGKPCPLDHFVDANGDCRICQAGFFRNAMTNRCQVCAGGLVSEGGKRTSCQKCAKGLIPRDGYKDRCLCPHGQVMKGGKCVKCPKGTATWIHEVHGRVCTACPKGRYAKKRGMAECKICPRGLVAIVEGASKCTKCPLGLIPRIVTISDVNHAYPHDTPFGNVCVSPRNGCPTTPYYAKYGIFPSLPGCLPKQCGANATDADAGKTCVPCHAGYTLDTYYKRYCEACPFDEVTDGTPSGVCTKCPKGMFRDVHDGSKCSCNRAGVGFFNGKCVQCPAGTSSPYGHSKCTVCPAGMFSNFMASETCTNCGEYSYAPKRGARRCQACPEKGVPNKKHGATQCKVAASSS